MHLGAGYSLGDSHLLWDCASCCAGRYWRDKVWKPQAEVISVALQRAISTQLVNNFKMRKGVGSAKDNLADLCSGLPLDERPVSAA